MREFWDLTLNPQVPGRHSLRPAEASGDGDRRNISFIAYPQPLPSMIQMQISAVPESTARRAHADVFAALERDGVAQARQFIKPRRDRI
jgi:hypothetical protein